MTWHLPYSPALKLPVCKAAERGLRENRVKNGAEQEANTRDWAGGEGRLDKKTNTGYTV